MKKSIRLQGEEWNNKKGDLLLVNYKVSNKYHIKGFYIDHKNNMFCHWLNDSEAKIAIEEFKKGIQEE